VGWSKIQSAVSNVFRSKNIKIILLNSWTSMEDVVIVVMIANGIKRAFVKSIPLMSLKKRSYTIISMKLRPNFCRLFAIIASLF